MSQDDPVKFTVVRTSDAVKKEVSISTANTKLIDLKRILAEDDCFGPNEAPVTRQRIFHLGRELKSGGRSLCNLGLGRFNNRIIHLCIRPALEEPGGDEEEGGDSNGAGVAPDQEKGSGRKRPRTEGTFGGREEADDAGSMAFSAQFSSSSSFSPFSFMHRNPVAPAPTSDVEPRGDTIRNTFHTDNNALEAPTISTFPTNNDSSAINNSAIDLLDSSDDENDEVEVIEIL
eukprot:jgi/Psemu1/67754/estExt_Genemark1.C_3630033